MSDLKRGGTLKRSGTTTKRPNVAGTKPKKDINTVKQGIKQLYPRNDAFVPEVDIILVPGLGAHPEKCWETKDFNWPTDGLAKDFPKSRILLYMYESVWQGALMVEQFMDNLALGLLTGLAAFRDKKCERRPIVFIGHSMGGLVVAKAVTLADSHRNRYSTMFEAIAAAIFFGTPFKGADSALLASTYASLSGRVGLAVPSELLDLMKPGNPQLRELVDDFTRLVGKSIEITCFFEERNTDLSSLMKLPGLFAIFPLPQSLAKFVTRESAVLEVSTKRGLAANHRDLVRFKSAQDSHYPMVRHEIKHCINAAESVVKNRVNAARGIDYDMDKDIDIALDGPYVAGRRKELSEPSSHSSWVIKEPEYIDWLAESSENQESDTIKPGDCLWVRARQGRGKTSASLAVIGDCEQRQAADQTQQPVRILHFFCEQSPYFCTAEDLLKSLLRQLIKQQKALSTHAKSFTKKAKGDKSQVQVTIENLWQALQDMLDDDFIGSKVIFVLNNLHVLPPKSPSTIKLMSYLNAELSDMNEMGSRQVVTRWFITSRDVDTVEKALDVDGVRLVDLEDQKYEDKVQLALTKAAKSKVTSLAAEKSYNKALAYFASSLLGKRAQNTQWIEISYVQLSELEKSESDLNVRRVLETLPQDLQTLLNNAWHQVFYNNSDDCDKIKEMLRALVLTYENPTDQELAVLAGLCSKDGEIEELHRLIRLCKPLCFPDTDGKVSFKHSVVKSHLIENARELLGMSKDEVKWQHGILAHRCFEHVKNAFDIEITVTSNEEQDEESNEEEEADSDEDDSDNESNDSSESYDDEYYEESDTESDEEEGRKRKMTNMDSQDEETDNRPEEEQIMDLARAYMVKYWLRHASKATFQIAEDLGAEEDFWVRESHIRRRWLIEYQRLTNTLHGFDISTWNALHVASAVGFQDLVAALIRNGHKDEITRRDELKNTPLHLAARFGQAAITRELLNNKAPVNDGIEANEQTPLHMAALGGHESVMAMLMKKGANPSAIAGAVGPVLNSAISSGNQEAVKLLVEKGVSLTIDLDPSLRFNPPLALAGLLSDISMFEYLVNQYRAKIPVEEYSKAFVKSAEAGRTDVFNKLLEYEHEHHYFQAALDAAVDELKWDIAVVLLKKQPGLDCNKLFHTAATAPDHQHDLLDLAWRYSNGGILQETVDHALYEATDCEKDSTVELLLGEPYKGSPNAKGDTYGNALTAAAYDGSEDIVNMLLKAKACPNDPAGWALQTAAARGHRRIVVELIHQGAKVNAVAKNPLFKARTALQGACAKGKEDIVRLLLKKDADPNLGGGLDGSPIFAATKNCEEEILQMLVDAKADVNVRGGLHSSTPLIMAAATMFTTSIEMLLHAGADISLANDQGDTALTMACRHSEAAIVEVLLDHGADMLHTNKAGKNALQVAFERDATECVQVLVERTSSMFGALRSAMDAGDTEVASVVRDARASKRLSCCEQAREIVQQLEYIYEDIHRLWLEGTPESGGEGMNDAEEHCNASTIGGPSVPEGVRYSLVDEVSDELKSALGNQILMYQQLSPGHSDGDDHTTPPTATQSPRFSSKAGPGWQQYSDMPAQPQSPPLSISSNGGVPNRYSVQTPPIRRKPTPNSRPSNEGLILASGQTTPSTPPSLTPGRPPKQYPQQPEDQQLHQQAPPLPPSRPYMSYNPNTSHTSQHPSMSSPSYFPNQPASSSPQPPVAPPKVPIQHAPQAGGYYGNDPGSRRESNSHPGGMNGSGYARNAAASPPPPAAIPAAAATVPTASSLLPRWPEPVWWWWVGRSTTTTATAAAATPKASECATAGFCFGQG
ncbi:hypothetical protein PG987_009817 [Apiospora arundinis]